MAINFRVKVYELNQSSGSWVGKGTGVVSLKYLPTVSSVGLQVLSDESERLGSVVLETKVCVNQDVYRRQGETIITWTDEYLDNKELALSFQDKDATQDIWNRLCNIQGWVTTPSESERNGNGSQLVTVENSSSTDTPAEAAKEQKRDSSEKKAATGLDNERSSIADSSNNESSAHANENGKSAQDNEQAMSYNVAVTELPEPTEENIHDILTFFDQLVGTAGMVRDYYARLILDPDYGEIKRAANEKDEADPEKKPEKAPISFEKNKSYLALLVELFPSLEEKQNMKALHELFDIIRAASLINEPKIFEFLLSDQYFEQVVGILEYDPDIPNRPNHRNYLKTHVRHKEVVPVKNEEILQKVHQNFRITFFKDVLLPRALDESTFSLLGDMELMNGIEIATALHGDSEFLTQLFSLLKAQNTTKSKRAEVIAFLQDLCSLAKKMQVPSRHAFYRSLIEKSGGFFSIFSTVLADEESLSSERVHVGDILKLSLEHDPELLRTYILNQKCHPKAPPKDTEVRVPKQEFAKPVETGADANGESLPLMAQLIKRLVYDSEPGMQAQACDVLKTMLDPETMEVNEKEKFLGLFYDYYIQWLVYPLNFAGDENEFLKFPDILDSRTIKESKTETATSRVGTDADSYKLTLHREKSDSTREFHQLSRSECRKLLGTQRVAHHHITELLSFCVQTHGYRIKYFVMRNDIVMKVLRLLHSKDKYLVLDAIRFVRTCIGLKDSFYNRYLVREDLLQGLFAIFLENGPRNNLINSSIIEMVEFIRMENLKKLVSYIVEKFGDVLKKADYVDTYPALKAVYDKNRKENDASEGKHATESVNNVKPAGQPFGTYGARQLESQAEEDKYFEESPNRTKKTGHTGESVENGHMQRKPVDRVDTPAKFMPRSSIVSSNDDDEDDIPFAKGKDISKSASQDAAKRDRNDLHGKEASKQEKSDINTSFDQNGGSSAPEGKRRKLHKVKISFENITKTGL
mmetsp:Transcript_171/g.271  ORF Transcript_171/g.271 Transcript_171/m.271 type:complete len:981 (+) Transcript_171:744-3686(+)